MLRFLNSLKKRLLKLLVRFIPGNDLRLALLRLAGYTIGSPVFIGEDFMIVDNQYQEPAVFIGSGVSIAQRVTLITSSGAPEARDIYKIFGSKVGPVVIEDGVWIGAGVIILPNITIGKSSIVGAGAVVTKNVPPCTMVVGVPARPLKRFSLETGEVFEI